MMRVVVPALLCLLLFLASCATPAATPTQAPTSTRAPESTATKSQASPQPSAASPTAAAKASGASTAKTLSKVKLGDTVSTSSAGIYVALERGYFNDVGIELDMPKLGAATDAIPPLSTGELDVFAGAISSGLFNAVARDLPLKVVADKGRQAPGYGYAALMVRKDLFDNGEIKSIEQLKGKSVSVTSRGSSTHFQVSKVLEKVKLTDKDIDLVGLGFGDVAAAFSGKSIQAALSIEPYVTNLIQQGLATKLISLDQVFPNYQGGVLIFRTVCAAQSRSGQKLYGGLPQGSEGLRGCADSGQGQGGDNQDPHQVQSHQGPRFIR